MSIILGIAAAVAFITALFYLTRLLNNRRKKELSRAASRVDLKPCRLSYRTPKGVKVFSQGEISDAHLSEIDAALTRLFEIARRRGYQNRLNFGDYTIFIPNPQLYRNGVPCFKIRLDEYDGTEFDQNPMSGIGEVFAPEYVLPDFSGFVVAYTDDMELLRTCVHNGAEHIILFENDRALYDQTAVHSNDNGHPILT